MMSVNHAKFQLKIIGVAMSSIEKWVKCINMALQRNLPLTVDEEISISSQKNRYSPYNLYNEKHKHTINKHSKNQQAIR